MNLTELLNDKRIRHEKIMSIARNIHPKLLKMVNADDILNDSTLSNDELLTQYNELLKPHINEFNKINSEIGYNFLVEYINNAVYVYDYIGYDDETKELISEFVNNETIKKITFRNELSETISYVMSEFIISSNYSPFWYIDYNYNIPYNNRNITIYGKSTPEKFIKDNSTELKRFYNYSQIQLLEKYINAKNNLDYEIIINENDASFNNIKKSVEEHLMLKYVLENNLCESRLIQLSFDNELNINVERS